MTPRAHNSNNNNLLVTSSMSWTHWLAAMSAIALTLSPSATTASSRPAAFIGVPSGVAAPFVAHRSSFRDPPAASGTNDVLLQLPSHHDNDPDRHNRMSLRSLSASGASEYDYDDTDTDASPFEQSPPPRTSNLSFPQMVVTDRSPLETTISSTIPPATAVPPPLLWTPENDDDNKYIEPVVLATTSSSATVPRASLRTKLGLSAVKRTNENEEATSSRLPRSSSIKTKVVGHRGALYEFLENTREGFVHCAQMGCHAIELDVFFLPRDGSVVVFHGTDDDEHRPGLLRHYCLGYEEEEEEDDNASTSQHCSIVDLTYAEAQLLQFNPDFAEFGCDRRAVEQGRIPLLEDVLQDLRAFPDLEIKIELKGHGTVQPVLDIVERWQMQRQCSYSSFDLQQLYQLRQLRPDTTLYRTGALFAGVPPTNWLALARDCGATEIHLQYDECTTTRMAAIHQAGFGSMAWFRGPRGMQADALHKYSDDMHTGEDERCYTTVLETGVQQVCCNRPNVLLRLLTELQQEQQQTWTVG